MAKWYEDEYDIKHHKMKEQYKKSKRQNRKVKRQLDFED